MSTMLCRESLFLSQATVLGPPASLPDDTARTPQSRCAETQVRFDIDWKSLGLDVALLLKY